MPDTPIPDTEVSAAARALRPNRNDFSNDGTYLAHVLAYADHLEATLDRIANPEYGEGSSAESIARAVATVREHDDRDERCTGLAAEWCPIHGECTCPDRTDWGELSFDECPLHGSGSTHADGPDRDELTRGVVEALAWALDLLDMYDEHLVELGDFPEVVYSDTHLAGKAKARAALAALDGSGT